MNTQKTYYEPSLHAVTGLTYHTTNHRPIFQEESNLFGVCSLDAPLVLPLGGVSILMETDRFVMAKDFVSARAS